MREFYREPMVLFWNYSIPILMTVALGVAFRSSPGTLIVVDVQEDHENSSNVQFVRDVLNKEGLFRVETYNVDTCRQRLRTGKTTLVIVPPGLAGTPYKYLFDPTREDSRFVQSKVDDVLQRAAGRTDPLDVWSESLNEPGGRYIDFLVPGLIAMSLMSTGLSGVSAVVVSIRVRKVLRRLLVTPMRKRDFLMSILLSQLLLLIPEVLSLLLFARVVFDVVIHGSLLAIVTLIVIGAVTFLGLGLLVAGLVQTPGAVSGLMNFMMLPMLWLSGVFFSSERFPEAARPFIKALPLTALVDGLRSVSLEGKQLGELWLQVAILAIWATGSLVLAIRWFYWN